MPEKPLISIITVNLNNLEGLQRTMQSVFEQTWQEFEYIVIDGGSVDGSKEYIEQHQEKISFWVSEPDKGIYNGMNKGIKVATGEYLLFLNSGDHFYEKSSLLVSKTYLNKEIVYFDMQIIENDQSYHKQFPSNLSFSYFTKDTLPHQGAFIKKRLFKYVGLYDEEMIISSDWKFFLDAICQYNCSYLKISKILSCHYLNGISAKPENRKIIQKERETYLASKYSAYMSDALEISNLKQQLNKVKKSKKIQLLIYLGLLQKI